MRRREVQSCLRLLLFLELLLALSALPVHATASPKLPEGLVAPDQSTAMPVFDLPNANGDSVRSEALHGKVVVLRFWASW